MAPSVLQALPSALEPAAPPQTRTQSVKAQVLNQRKGVVVQRADLGQTEEQALNGEPPPEDSDFGPSPFDTETGEISEPGAAG